MAGLKTIAENPLYEKAKQITIKKLPLQEADHAKLTRERSLKTGRIKSDEIDQWKLNLDKLKRYDPCLINVNFNPVPFSSYEHIWTRLNRSSRMKYY